MTDIKQLLHHCLYFTANTLSRVITRMAEEEFRKTGLSPSHAILMMVVIDRPGIGQKALGEYLHLAPSTVTRFVDTLVYRGYVSRESEGKTTKIHATAEGRRLRQPIADAWKGLYHRYTEVLGQDSGDDLTRRIDLANQKLEKP